MPSISIYIEEKIYRHLTNKGKASSIGKKWIEEKYEQEVNKK